MSDSRTASRIRSADLGERTVAGEVPDVVVHALEVVDVDDHERETAPVAVRAGDLSRERLVEVAAVVEARQRIEVGLLARLLKAPRVLERRRDALGELLGAAKVVVAEPRLRVAGEDAEPADAARAVDERDAERRAYRSLGSLRIPVRKLHRARAPVSRLAEERRRVRLVAAEPAGTGDRLRDVASVADSVEPDERRVDPRKRERRVERRVEHVVEVDRRPDLVEEPAALRLLLGPAHALLQLARELFHPRLEIPDGGRVGDRRGGGPLLAPHEDDERHDGGAEGKRE